LDPSSFYLFIVTPESGPKHSILHCVGLPAATDLDIAEVKAIKPEKLNWLELGVESRKEGQEILPGVSVSVVGVPPNCRAPYSSDGGSFVCFASTRRGHKSSEITENHRK